MRARESTLLLRLLLLAAAAAATAAAQLCHKTADCPQQHECCVGSVPAPLDAAGTLPPPYLCFPLGQCPRGELICSGQQACPPGRACCYRGRGGGGPPDPLRSQGYCAPAGASCPLACTEAQEAGPGLHWVNSSLCEAAAPPGPGPAQRCCTLSGDCRPAALCPEAAAPLDACGVPGGDGTSCCQLHQPVALLQSPRVCGGQDLCALLRLLMARLNVTAGEAAV